MCPSKVYAISRPECSTSCCFTESTRSFAWSWFASWYVKATGLYLYFGLVFSNSTPDQTIILLEVEKIISVTSDFSLPFCQLRLQILFNAESDEEVKNSIVDAMFKVAKAGARARNPHWVDLVSVLGQDAVRQVQAFVVFILVLLLIQSRFVNEPKKNFSRSHCRKT